MSDANFKAILELEDISSGLQKPHGFEALCNPLAKSFEEGNYKEQIMAVNERWADVEYWRAIKRRAPSYTYSKYLKGVDMYQNEEGKFVQVEEDRRIYKKLFLIERN